ncbi:MAG: acyl-phosphate glycerol 3-phosphate acyltransferase [Fluviicola sp.]|nr:MAG: acyl-phosphate glycerol 3-phosphate acyltransferase [Fluviicola sp.]
MMEFILFGLIAYLLGSIPTSVWVGKAKFNVDVRQHGSNNAGATNTFRVLGKKAGTFVLIIDICKGAIAVLLPYITGFAEWKSDELIHLQLVTGVLAVVGHIFPLFAGFNGGKGVATSLGVIIGIHPPAAIICIIVFLIFFILSSFVSLGAILGAISFPLSINLIFGNENLSLMIFSILLASAVVVAHHKNIRRIIDGNENKMNLFKK